MLIPRFHRSFFKQLGFSGKLIKLGNVFSQATSHCEFSEPLDDINAPDLTTNVLMTMLGEAVTSSVTVKMDSFSFLFVAHFNLISRVSRIRGVSDI